MNKFDLKTVIQALHENRSDFSKLGSIVFDTLFACNDYDAISFQYCHWLANQVAHFLAKLALSIKNEQY